MGHLDLPDALRLNAFRKLLVCMIPLNLKSYLKIAKKKFDNAFYVHRLPFGSMHYVIVVSSYVYSDLASWICSDSRLGNGFA